MTRVEKFHNLFSQGTAVQLSDYVSVNHDMFNSLISIYIGGPSRITQRAAHPLTTVSMKHPELLTPHLGTLLRAINAADVSVALKRNTIRMFQFVTIPRDRHGRIIDICFRFLMDNREPIAVKVFAMTVIERLSTKHSEIRKELKTVIEDQLPYAGAAFRSRASKIMRKLDG